MIDSSEIVGLALSLEFCLAFYRSEYEVPDDHSSALPPQNRIAPGSLIASNEHLKLASPP